MHPGLKMAVDYGPLLAFFITNAVAGLMAATAAVMITSLLALGLGYWAEKKLAPAPLLTAVVVSIMGGLTLYLQDETFIKIKPTLVYVIFASLIAGGLLKGKLWIKMLLGSAVEIDDAAWRSLSVRWCLFFVAMAITNECVWRNVETDTWVTFKVFGATGLTLVFALSLVPFLGRHQKSENGVTEGSELSTDGPD